MQYVQVGTQRLPAVAVGCMGLSKLNEREAADFIASALGEGLCFFEHADIYET